MAEEKLISEEMKSEKRVVRLFGIALGLLLLRLVLWAVRVTDAYLNDTWEIKTPEEPLVWIEIVLYCIAFTVISYLILIFIICRTRWVKETIQFRLCWIVCSWKTPWMCVVSLWCICVEFVRWVLQIFCRVIIVRIIILRKITNILYVHLSPYKS